MQVTCMLVDEAGCMLWTGHADGRVTGFWLGAPPGSAVNNRQKHHWQVGAFRHRDAGGCGVGPCQSGME